MKKFTVLYSVSLFILLCFSVQAQQNHLQETYQKNDLVPVEQQAFSDAELAQMLAPIALYPDSLLTHILIASTYPIEIIEAHRWLEKNENLNANQIAKAIENFDWDASVKALVPFEQIVSRLNDDLDWMQQLGDAFLQDESRVLASIQTLRYEAKHAGNLSKMANMEVSYDEDNIIIEPKEKEIVYVPYYDTRMVYGAWRWSLFPPIHWSPHHHVYINHHNPFHWYSGIRISFNYFFSTFHWHNRHVLVINPKRTHHYRARKLITHGGYAKPWLHKPVHRRGVSYKNKIVREKYYGKSKKFNRPKKHHNSINPSVSLNKYHAAHTASSQHKLHQPTKGIISTSGASKRQVIQKVNKNNNKALLAKTPNVVTYKQQNRVVAKSHQQVKIKTNSMKRPVKTGGYVKKNVGYSKHSQSKHSQSKHSFNKHSHSKHGHSKARK